MSAPTIDERLLLLIRQRASLFNLALDDPTVPREMLRRQYHEFEEWLDRQHADQQPVLGRSLRVLRASLEGDLEPKGTEQPDYLHGKQAGLRLAIGRVDNLLAACCLPYIVGEHGPETFVPSQSGYVLPPS